MSAPTNAQVADSRRAQSARENARKSTGPRTPEGKSRAAQNALTHGAFAQNLLLPHEDKEHFAQHYCTMLKSLHPANALQTFLAQRIIALTWRLNRLHAAESYLHVARMGLYQEHVGKLNKNPDAKKLAPEYAGSADSSNLRDGFILGYEYDKRENNAFESLNKTEQRLSNMLHRAVRDLKSLQENPQDGDSIDDPNPLAKFLVSDADDQHQDDDQETGGQGSARAEVDHPATAEPSNSICENEAKCQSVSPPEPPAKAFFLERLEST
jgi:hypothetical protein